MKSILQINASLNSRNGESSRLADAFVSRLRAQYPGTTLTLRDLARDPVPHLDAERFGAFIAKPEARTPAQRAVVDYSDKLIAELQRADAIVIGLPMYNFGVPSQLKAWIDHIARAGVTFRYTEKGSVGLLTEKKAWVFATRGGRYAGTAADSQTPGRPPRAGVRGARATGLAVARQRRWSELIAVSAASLWDFVPSALTV